LKPKGPLSKKFAYTDEQDEFLRDQLKQAKSLAEVAISMDDKFGTNRTVGALDMRRRALGIDFVRPFGDKYKRWTEEEDAILIEACQQYPKWRDRLSHFETLSGTSRSLVSVVSRAGGLGLTFEKASVWSKEETDFLVELKSNCDNWDEILSRFHRRFGTSRSLNALQSRVRKSETAK
jgi:hypothetical protein